MEQKLISSIRRCRYFKYRNYIFCAVTADRCDFGMLLASFTSFFFPPKLNLWGFFAIVSFPRRHVLQFLLLFLQLFFVLPWLLLPITRLYSPQYVALLFPFRKQQKTIKVFFFLRCMLSLILTAVATFLYILQFPKLDGE